MLAGESLTAIVHQLKGYDPIRIMLFGSAARGEADSWSDLDLVVIKDTASPFLQRYREIAPFLHNTTPIDLFIYTPGEFERMKASHNPFIERVLKEGKVIYEKERV